MGKRIKASSKIKSSPPRGGLPLDVIPFQLYGTTERHYQYSKSTDNVNSQNVEN
jgi:hypothetical protein